MGISKTHSPRSRLEYCTRTSVPSEPPEGATGSKAMPSNVYWWLSTPRCEASAVSSAELAKMLMTVPSPLSQIAGQVLPVPLIARTPANQRSWSKSSHTRPETQDTLIHIHQLRVHQPPGPHRPDLVGILAIENANKSVAAITDIVFKNDVSR